MEPEPDCFFRSSMNPKQPCSWEESFCSSLNTSSMVKKFERLVVRRVSMSLNIAEKIW